MTLPLLKVAELGEENETLANVQFNFDQIAKLFLDAGNRAVKVRFGAGTVTFTASSSSSVETVTHGMGSTPIAVGVFDNGGLAAFIHFAGYSIDGTDFSVQGVDVAGAALTGDHNFSWIALG